MMNQKEWDLLSQNVLCCITDAAENGFYILRPSEAQDVKTQGNDEPIIRNYSSYEENYCVNGYCFTYNGKKYLCLNRKYFTYGYRFDTYFIAKACLQIKEDVSWLLSQ